MDNKLRVRRWKKTDLEGIYACQKAAYPDYPEDSLCDVRHYKMQLEAFPEGQFLAEIGGKVVGYATSLIVDLAGDDRRYSYSEITGTGTFSTHDPSGVTLFGADIAVHPGFRGQGISAKLYKRRKNLVRDFNLKRMLAYGRIPGYKDVAGKMTPHQYIDKVKNKELRDTSLSAHLSAGYAVKGVLLDYMGDRSSLNHATLLEWENPRFDRVKRKVAAAPLRRVNRKARVCSAQLLVRPISTEQDFSKICRFFAESASLYHCHFLVLPEYFSTQLLYTMPHRANFVDSVYDLAARCEEISSILKNLALEYQLYIVGGSTPQVRNGKLYNVSCFITPSGNIYYQDKLHVTPAERDGWGITPGEAIKIFETPLGRVAIQICYDIEFPEISRLLAFAGVEIVFVPFNTDEQKSYNRVHMLAQARAVENYMYVVTSALVGNMPTMRNYLINYGRSAIYTPSDVAFPTGAILGIADPNVETIVTSELDLEVLALQREVGSVLPFYDRRLDLYNLELKAPIEIVMVE